MSPMTCNGKDGQKDCRMDQDPRQIQSLRKEVERCGCVLTFENYFPCYWARTLTTHYLKKGEVVLITQKDRIFLQKAV